MPPSYVKAYLKRSKNNANDAAAICEAVTRPSMRFVPTKSEQQQAGLMLHRSRQLRVRQRTMLSNAIRGHMAELGIISAQGRNGAAELTGTNVVLGPCPRKRNQGVMNRQQSTSISGNSPPRTRGERANTKASVSSVAPSCAA